MKSSEVILATGTNTTENHPVLSSFIKRAVKYKNAKLIVIDPRKIKFTQYADKWLRAELGTEVAWINGLMHVIIKEDLHDKAFVENRTTGFEEIKKRVEIFTPEYVEEITRIPAQDLIDAVRTYAGASRGSILLYGHHPAYHRYGQCEIFGQPGHALRKLGVEGGGITYERIEHVGLHWPCITADHPGTPVLHIGQFPIGKGVFHDIDFIPPAEKIDEEYPLYLTTGRVLYHYHTGTMTRKTQGLNERSPENFVEISENDAKRYEVADGNTVNVASRRGDITVRVKVSDMAVEGTVFIPFHFAEAAANKLTNAVLDPVSKIPEYKGAVKLSKPA